MGSYEGTDITIKPSNEGLTKDIVIKGRTLQNIFPSESTGMDRISNTTLSNGVITYNPAPNNYCYVWEVDPTLYKPNTVYTVIIDILENTLVKSSNVTDSQCGIILGASPQSVFENGKQLNVLGQNGRLLTSLTTRADFSNITGNRGVRVYLNNSFDSGVLKYTMMVLEGDYTQPNSYIPPYFKGIKSVGEPTPEGGTKVVYGSCGKNLMKTETFEVQVVKGDTNNGKLDKIVERNIEVDPKKTYVLSYDTNKERLNPCKILGCNTPIPSDTDSHNNAYVFCMNNGGQERSKQITGFKYITITTGGSINLNLVQVGETVSFSELQLEEGTEATAYEPYQEDVKEITVNLDGGLGGLPNGVHNYLYSNKAYSNNLYLVQVVGSYTITGDEVWVQYPITEGFTCVGFYYLLPSSLEVKDNSSFMCNNFKGTIRLAFPGSLAIDEEAIFVEGRSGGSSPSYIKISISKAKLATPDIEGFKAWLKANPTTVYYELANPIYSEVSTDNFNLKTFDGATHVFSKHDFKPTIAFSTDFVLLTSDAKQYCTADGNKSFILPDIASLQDSNALEIHLFVKMLANATLSFPSNILWNDLAKMNEVTKGSTAEFVFTYIKTAEGGSWLGTVVPHK